MDVSILEQVKEEIELVSKNNKMLEQIDKNFIFFASICNPNLGMDSNS